MRPLMIGNKIKKGFLEMSPVNHKNCYMRKMHLIWHMRESLIFAYVAQSHGGRELVECGAYPLSPHVIVPHGANMRGTLICHMRCIFLIYIYIYIYIYAFDQIRTPHIMRTM